MAPDDAGPAPEPSLGDVDVDRLLGEVRRRMHGVLDEQDRLRHLLDAVVGITAELSLDAVLARIVTAAGRLVDARYVALGVVTEEKGGRLSTFIHRGMEPEVVTRIGDLPTGHGLLGLLIDDPRPIRLHDLATHPRSYGFPEPHPPMSSFLGVPVRSRGRVFGNLYLTEKAGGEDFSDFDESIAVALASAAGVAIENATLYEAAERRQQWLEATAEITALLADDDSAGQALQAVADHARTVSRADVSWVVTGSDPCALHLGVVSGAPVDLEAMRALPMERSLASTVVRTGTAISVEDVGADPRAVDPSTIPGWPRLGPVLVLPLRCGGVVDGVLSLAWTPDRSQAFRDLDPALPVAFAEQAALALQVARRREDGRRLTLYEDRDRIGRDLHDLVIQRLFAIGLGLQGTAKLVPEGEVAARLGDAIDDLDATIMDIRRTIFALGTFETAQDVQSEVERLVRRAGATMKMRPSLRFDGPVRSAIPRDVVPDLLAVLSEALTNVTRHAQASNVDVEVKVDGSFVEVRVTDDGCGVGADVVESGLHNMRARARRRGGELVVESGAGSGTSIVWRVPFEQPGC
ncbi:MAG TPA: GAF domain-containing protein [Nocardioides sp.]|nr:GAF domain-containing protein [Nocardioides sp.]